jgi:hypothetical protein
MKIANFLKNTKQIVFRLSWKKLIKTILVSSIEFIFVTSIIVLMGYIFSCLYNYGYYPINEYLEKIHTIFFFLLYCLLLIVNILHMLLEKRKEPRYHFASLLNLVLNKKFQLEAITINLSPSEACIYTPIKLSEGQHLKLHKHAMPYPYKDAVVRWYDKKSKKAGMTFLKNNDGK